MCLPLYNPNGIASFSPGLSRRAGSYPGLKDARSRTLKEGVSLFSGNSFPLIGYGKKMQFLIRTAQLEFCGYAACMLSLAQTGTRALLEQLSPFLDDVLIKELLPSRRKAGRPRFFSPAQLFRVLLLSLLTPAHSFNLLVKVLSENRAWRKFAHLPNQRVLPDAKMLHQFRDRLDLIVLRQINAHLLRPLLNNLDPSRPTVAIMDSTDLPAPVNSFKKNASVLGAARRSGCAHGQKRTESLVHRIQKTQPAALACATARGSFARAIDVMDSPSESGRCALFGTQPALPGQALGVHT
jgi:hypothetical protein